MRTIFAAEFATLGALAGSIGAAGALVTGWAVTTRVLDLPYHFNPEILLIGVDDRPNGATHDRHNGAG